MYVQARGHHGEPEDLPPGTGILASGEILEGALPDVATIRVNDDDDVAARVRLGGDGSSHGLDVVEEAGGDVARGRGQGDGHGLVARRGEQGDDFVPRAGTEPGSGNENEGGLRGHYEEDVR